MADDSGLVGERLIMLGKPGDRKPNTYPLWRYLLLLIVLVTGCVYALPNLYPPDFALQIKSRVPDQVLDAKVLEEALTALSSAGVEVKASSVDGKSALIRVNSSADQLRSQNLINQALNAQTNNYIIALNLASNTPDWLADIGGKPMAKGLDLSGGIHFLLEVDMNQAVVDRMKSLETGVRTAFRENSLRPIRKNVYVDGRVLEVSFNDVETRDTAADLFEEDYADFDSLRFEVDDKPTFRLTMTDDMVTEIEDYAIAQNLQSLRNRVNELGVSEPLVQRLGRNRIVLELPGIQDSARAKEIINKFANLEFRLVALASDRASQVERYRYEGREVVIQRANIVTGERVTSASQGYDQESGLPQVNIKLDSEGGKRMNQITSKHVRDSMAILFIEKIAHKRKRMVDGVEVEENYFEEERKLISVATIQSALGFNFRITGLGLGEARDLALLLRAGALAAPMFIVEERTVGASLGEDNIKAGGLSVAVGFSLVLVFMLVYFKMFGLAADIALTANLILLVAVMSILGATLTLPGIAGIVLTVGMAVDANVLIFARIKEELRSRSPQQAIQAGFDRAFITILDANITTFFVAVILLSIGSGPVKGFAVTLAVGIATSMFTAIMGTRAIINLIYGGRNVKKLAI